MFIISNVLFNSCTNKKNKPTDEKHVHKETLKHHDSVQRNFSKYLKQDELVDYLSKSRTVIPIQKTGKPFDTLKYNKVIAYDYEGNEEPYGSVMDINGKYVPVILKQKYLTQAQTSELIKFITANSTYGGGTSACFNPHLGFIFYNSEKIACKIDICLDCNYLISTSEIPAMNNKKANIGTGNEFSMIGFSKIGQQKIINLCRELGFYYGGKKLKGSD